MKFKVLDKVMYGGKLHTVVEIFLRPGHGYRHRLMPGEVTQEQIGRWTAKGGFCPGRTCSASELTPA